MFRRKLIINQLSKDFVVKRMASTTIGKASKILFYSLTGSAITVSGASAYAIYDPKFRSSLEQLIPGAQTIIKSIEHFSLIDSKKNEKIVLNEKPLAKKSKSLEPLYPNVQQSPKPGISPEDVSTIIDDIIDKKISALTESQKTDLTGKLQTARSDFEKELKQEIVKVQAAQAAHEEEMLRAQRESLEIKNKQNVQKALLKERKDYAEKLASAVAKLAALQTFLNGRAEFDGQNRRSKKLWISCQNLRALLVANNEKSLPLSETSKSIANIVSDISSAGESDEFIETALQSLPKDAVQRGVYTENELTERYDKVKRICRRLATVGENEGRLSKYMLSTLQSFFIIDSIKETFGNTNIDVEKLSTYEILSRTSFCLQRKDFHSAIRLMSLLKGKPSEIASDWLSDLKIHVETRQLADVLIAHASAQSIRSLY